MKLIFLLLISTNCFCQFHVAVEANPDNGGEVNISWVNNFVVTVTNDNWKTKKIIQSRAYYQGYDDNGVRFYTCYYQQQTFQKREQAIAFAKSFTSYKYFLFYEDEEYKSYLAAKAIYGKQNKKLCFGCKDKKSERPKAIVVH